MIQIPFTDQDVETLAYERYHYPDPKVQRKCEVVYLKSQGLSHTQIARLAGVSTRTVQRYLNDYHQGGIEKLKENNYRGQPSSLDNHAQTLKDYFTKYPPHTIAQAQKVIEELTGIKRSLTQIRALLKRLGLQRRKVGSAPGKGDDPDKLEEQRQYVQDKLDPCLEEAEQAKAKIFFSTPVISCLGLFFVICGASCVCL
ncbi:MAG: transposase [Gemmataceae bacterium]